MDANNEGGEVLTVYVVSDSTGATAARMVQAALAQFGGAPVALRRRPEVRTAGQVREVIREAAATNALIVHTMVSAELRAFVLAEARSYGVDSMDLLGPLLDRLSAHLELQPQEMPGIFEQLAEARTRETEALHFAFRHDDGQHFADLHRADIVLVGISRTMKTPVMLYLASRGWKTANVPLLPEYPPPEELLAVSPERVFCLQADPGRLSEFRRVRARQLDLPDRAYVSAERIMNEQTYAERLCAKYGWRIVSVTGKSVEEISLEITTILGVRITSE